MEKLTDALANPVDVHVGRRLKQRRTFLGWSQEKLGNAIGLTFQQVQKYERGKNRISASRLFELSRVLDVPVSYFFDGAEQNEYGLPQKNAPAFGLRLAENQDPFDAGVMDNKETMELVRHYYKINDPKLRKQVMEMAKVLSQISDESDDGGHGNHSLLKEKNS